MTCRGDRGAVLILVAVFALVAVAMLAAVVDLGGLRQEKKEVTLSTDAAALAAAQVTDIEDVDLVHAVLGTGVECSKISQTADGDPTDFVQDIVDEYLTRNGDSSPVSCFVHRTGSGTGYVTVNADEDYDFSIGPAIGVDGGTVAGESTAAIESDPGGGLRPVPACQTTLRLDSSPKQLQAILLANVGTGAISPPESVTLPVEKLNDSDSRCGNADGHFGQVDFVEDGPGQGSCGNDPQPHTYCDYLENGYFDPVDLATAGDTGDNYGPQVREEFQDLIDEVGNFWIPIYDEVLNCRRQDKNDPRCADSAGNPNAFNLTYFAEVELDGFCLLGRGDRDTGDGCEIAFDADGSGDIAKNGSEDFNWMRLVIHRVEIYLPPGPSVTLDANFLPPRLCDEPCS